MKYVKIIKNSPIILGLAALGIGQTSVAAPSPIGLGALAGVSVVSGATQFTFGAEGTYEFQTPWTAGFSVTYYSSSASLPTLASASSSFLTLTAMGLYSLSTLLEGLRVGAQLGLGISSTNVPGASGSTNLILGPTANYDFFLSPKFSVGAESTLYFNTASGSSPLWQVMGAVKYWL